LYAYACMWCIFVCLCILFNPKTIKCKNKHCSNVMICNDHDRAVLFCLQLLERRKRKKTTNKKTHTKDTQHNQTNKPHLPFFLSSSSPMLSFHPFHLHTPFPVPFFSHIQFFFQSSIQSCIAERDGKVAPKKRNQTIASLIGGHGWVAKRKERNEKEKKERKEK